MNTETWAFIYEHVGDDVRQLMLGRPPQGVDLRQACVQIAARQRAVSKLPSWAVQPDIVFPEQLPMEQCSSELTASYKAECLAKQDDGSLHRIADLTGGFGVDATMLARQREGIQLIFVEQNPELCELARHNLPIMGVKNVEVKCADAVQMLNTLPRQDLIYLDPARRDGHGGRTVAITDCTPNVELIQDQLLDHADVVIVKLSPMLDLSDALRRLLHVKEVHVVSVDGECKEVLVIISAKPHDTLPITCVNLSARHKRQTFTFTREGEQQVVCTYTSDLGKYLYEPNASVLKAAAFKSVAQHFGLCKLHPSSHLYTADELIPDFPGRCFEVAGVSDFNKKNIKGLLRGIDKANLTVRNHPQSVAELRQRLKINEGGSDYLFATTLANEKHILVLCRKTV